MFYAIRASFKYRGKLLSVIYAVSALGLSLFMGGALQSYTVVDATREIFDTPPWVPAIFFALLVFISVVGGTKIISKITLISIPLTTIIYICLCLAVIIINAQKVPETLIYVFRSAFTKDAALGGILGYLASSAVREGYSRGILSNEAGAGTSTLAHATSMHDTPHTAGLFGILEVFFDTVILCTATALAILLSVPDVTLFSGGMPLVLSAIGGTLGTVPSYLLLFSVFVFAYSTTVCWCFYGTSCLLQLGVKKPRFLFLPIFLLFTALGAMLSEGVLVFLSDLLLLILTLITLPTLIKNSDRIVHLSESGALLKPRRANKKSKETNSRKRRDTEK